MALQLNWTENQTAEVLGYLANPMTESRLEIQVRPDRQTPFEQEYEEATGIVPPPVGTAGYSVLRTTSDKQGDQMRVYFLPVGEVPTHLDEIMRNASRDQRRVSRNALVSVMLRHGFLLGQNQYNRIRQTINANQMPSFNQGHDSANQ